MSREVSNNVRSSAAEPSTRSAKISAPRVPDLRHLSFVLGELAEQSQQGLPPVELARNLGQGLSILERAEKSVLAVNDGSALDALCAVRQAIDAVRDAQEATDALRPSLPRLPGSQLRYPVAVRHQLAAAAVKVAEAETASEQLDPRRHVLDMFEAPSVGLRSDALEQAREVRRHRRSLDRMHLPVQTAGEQIGPRIVKVFKSFQVVGAENIPREGPFILTPTHGGGGDGRLWLSLIGRLTDTPLRRMKKPIAPGVDAFDALHGAFFVKAGTSTGHLSLAVANELLERGQAVVVFPEGRYVRSDVVAPIYPGAARMALEANVPIIPVAYYGNKKASVHGAKKRRLVINIGSPINPQGAPTGRHNVGVITDRLQGSLQALYSHAKELWHSEEAFEPQG